MSMQKLERAFAVDAVAALKEFDFGSVGQPELRIKPAGLCIFMADPRINGRRDRGGRVPP